LLVFLLAALFFVSPALFSPFATRGQTREAVVAMNMLQQQNYILPLRNGAEIPSKPPMFHWLVVAVSQLAGQLNEATTRAPSAVTGALTVAITYAFAATTASFRVAALSALILATSLEFIRNANVARVDMVFTFFLCSAFFLLHRII